MNLEREEQLFEEWCEIFGLPTDQVDQEYTDSRTSLAWLAWYEVLNRKGYKLVPVEPTWEMIDAMCESVIFGEYANGDPATLEVGESKTIYKAMIDVEG